MPFDLKGSIFHLPDNIPKEIYYTGIAALFVAITTVGIFWASPELRKRLFDIDVRQLNATIKAQEQHIKGLSVHAEGLQIEVRNANQRAAQAQTESAVAHREALAATDQMKKSQAESATAKAETALSKRTTEKALSDLAVANERITRLLDDLRMEKERTEIRKKQVPGSSSQGERNPEKKTQKTKSADEEYRENLFVSAGCVAILWWRECSRSVLERLGAENDEYRLLIRDGYCATSSETKKDVLFCTSWLQK